MAAHEQVVFPAKSSLPLRDAIQLLTDQGRQGVGNISRHYVTDLDGDDYWLYCPPSVKVLLHTAPADGCRQRSAPPRHLTRLLEGVPGGVAEAGPLKVMLQPLYQQASLPTKSKAARLCAVWL